MEIVIDVDDGDLADHNENHPPPKDVSEWDFSDLVAAVKLGYVNPGESTIEDYTALDP
jgi:hypothetical protein